MPRPGMAFRAALDPASLTPSDQPTGNTAITGDGQSKAQGTGTPYGDPEVFAISPDGTRTTQDPLAPGTWQEHRIMEANRANPSDNFIPGVHNANADPQKGGSPGGSQKTSYTDGNVITSQGPDGVTRVNGVPPSPRKLAYGWSDYWGHTPTFVASHLKIQWNANPNKPQLNPTPFNTEGPSANTRYSTPSPFAAGTFIG